MELAFCFGMFSGAVVAAGLTACIASAKTLHRLFAR